jgi:ppGpp synthetase/RelA/SpoT-type nucleotidyltranferase
MSTGWQRGPRLFLLSKALDKSKLVKKQITDKTGRRTTKWVRPGESEPVRTHSKQEAEHKDKGTLNEFQALKQELSPMLKPHTETFNSTIEEMEKAFPKAKVYGRVKDLDSAADKVFIRRSQGNPNYTIKDIQDLTGTRVEVDTVDGVFDAVKKLKKMYEVVEEDDYITNPKGIGYRRYHLIVKDKEGKVFEIQCGTKNQTLWADWCHDVYKPQSAFQKKVFEQYRDVVMEYAKATALYFNAKDTGKEPAPSMPPCTQEIKQAYGCLPTG